MRSDIFSIKAPTPPRKHAPPGWRCVCEGSSSLREFLLHALWNGCHSSSWRPKPQIFSVLKGSEADIEEVPAHKRDARTPEGRSFVTLTVFYRRLKQLRGLQCHISPTITPGHKERVEMTVKYSHGSKGEIEQGLKRDS